MTHAPAPSTGPLGMFPPAGDIRALAVVGVIFGTLGMSCLPFNFGAWITFGWPIETSKTNLIEVWCLGSTVVGLALSALLMFSSLGAFHFKSWGRYGLLFWAVMSLAYGVAGIFFWGRFLLPQLRWQYVTMRGPDEISGLLAWFIGSILAIFVLRLFTRPDIRSVFTLAHGHSVGRWN
jgi:hypothetical protein